MATLSAYDGNYRAWGRIIAARGVAVALIDFRNAVRPSTAPEVAPFPAGLIDVNSGLHWLHANAERLGPDRARIVVSGKAAAGTPASPSGCR